MSETAPVAGPIDAKDATPRPSPRSRIRAAITRPWASFLSRNLYDYTVGAIAAWSGIVLIGTVALIASVLLLIESKPEPLWLLLVLFAATGVAATLAFRIPRSAYTVSVADVFMYLSLAAFGPGAAAVAACIEAVTAHWRNSTRLSSRLASPAAAATAWLLTGLLHALLMMGLQRAGLDASVSMLVALCVVAPVSYIATAAPLLAMMALKRGEPLRPRSWFSASSWSAIICVGSGLVAAMLHLAALSHGPIVLAVSGAMVLVLALLVRHSLSQHERERAAQEAQVAAAREAAQASQARFEAAFTHAAIGMLVLDGDGCVLQANQAAARLLDLAEPSSLLGLCGEDLVDPTHRTVYRQALQVAPTVNPGRPLEVPLAGGFVAQRWVALHCSQYTDPQHAQASRILQLHDVSSRREAEDRLNRIAYHDELTGLANRHRFNQALAVAVDRAHDDPRCAFSVMFLDLDRFKTVNDSLGHHAGNELLRIVAQRLLCELRPSDLVARLGGDEFAVLVTDTDDPDMPVRVARRLIQALQQPVSLGNTEVSVGVSIGLTSSDLGHRTVDDVLRDADIAMYEAKAGGRRNVARFDARMHVRVADKLALETDLRRAIADDSLSLYFQPLHTLAGDRLIGFEALARWHHPRRGVVGPSVFVPLAEETGLVEQLSDWVVDKALAHLARWQRRWPEAAELGVSVNISSRDLGRLTFTPWVRQALQRHGVREGSLTLEITETSLMERMETAVTTMNQLRPDGVRFSIDDFGTGYSSLAYLGTLPIDSLKIDQSFVAGLHTQPHSAEIVRAVVDLGRSLGRRVVAEGIETPEQLASLRTLGVCIGQGYLLSRPIPVEAVETLLERRFNVPATA